MSDQAETVNRTQTACSELCKLPRCRDLYEADNRADRVKSEMQSTSRKWFGAVISVLASACIVLATFSAPARAQTDQVDVKLAWDYSDPGAQGFVLYCGLSSRSYSTRLPVGNGQTRGTTLKFLKGAVRFCTVSAADANGDESSFSNEVAVSVTPAGAVTEEVPLTVQDVTVTPAGLEIRFNRRIDYGALDLYSWQPDGQPDITLLGNSVGSVRGSLVIHPDKLGFTFVNTDGVLTADSYQLTIFSRSDGLLDEYGRTIANSTTKTFEDYVMSFAVASSSSPVVSIPRFARGPGQPTNIPLLQDNAGIPVTITNGAGISSVEFVLQYQPYLLTLTDVVPLRGTLSIKQIDSTAGTARVRLTGLSGLTASATALLSLRGSVPAGAPYRAAHVLNITQLSLNNGAVAGRDDDGLHVVAFPGDSSGNGSYTGLDPQLTKRIVDGYDTGFSAYRLIDPRVIADVNGDGRLDSDDETGVVELCAATVTTSSYWNVTRALRCAVTLP